MSAYIPPQWKEYLKKWVKKDRAGFVEHLELMKENAELAKSISDKALVRNDYEEHLYFKESFEDLEEEIEYTENLLN